MKWAAIVQSPPDLKEEDLKLFLAHFPPDLVSPNALVSAVERAAQIHVHGIRAHPKGSVIALRTTDLPKLTGKQLLHGKVSIFLTPFPEVSIPLADRGKRWRISGVPFHLGEKAILLELEAANPSMKFTCVKRETLQAHPLTRTQFVSFWVKDSDTKPLLRTLAGAPIVVFDPEPKKSSTSQLPPVAPASSQFPPVAPSTSHPFAEAPSTSQPLPVAPSTSQPPVQDRPNLPTNGKPPLAPTPKPKQPSKAPVAQGQQASPASSKTPLGSPSPKDTTQSPANPGPTGIPSKANQPSTSVYILVYDLPAHLLSSVNQDNPKVVRELLGLLKPMSPKTYVILEGKLLVSFPSGELRTKALTTELIYNEALLPCRPARATEVASFRALLY